MNWEINSKGIKYGNKFISKDLLTKSFKPGHES